MGFSSWNISFPASFSERLQKRLLTLLVFSAVLALAIGAYRQTLHIASLEVAQMTIKDLPGALMLSFFRMVGSYIASLIFAFILGLLAARTWLGERIIIPLLDILQSIPVVGFFPAAIAFFIGISGGNRFGVELAAVFLIFTSQAWNMAFAVYEATKSIPSNQFDAIRALGVKDSQRFWKLYAPACTPRLIYNSILSWSNGWYFLVACEIIAVGPAHYYLPGIGSFLALAAEQDQIRLVIWGLISLSSLILVMDFIIWRPLSLWGKRFSQGGLEANYYTEHAPITGAPFFFRFALPKNIFIKISEAFEPVRDFFRMLVYYSAHALEFVLRKFVFPIFWDLPAIIFRNLKKNMKSVLPKTAAQTLGSSETFNRKTLKILSIILSASLLLIVVFFLYKWVSPPWPPIVKKIPLALLASTGRLIVALVLSFAWILPLILWTWNKPRLKLNLTTIAQIGASLPAIALFPLLIVLTIKKFGGGMEIASILLLLTGMQWYILFNGLGGTAIIPSDLSDVSKSLGLTQFLVWRKLVLPAIRPALVTGAITAWGGGWNALVVSEYVIFKDQTLKVRGIGALLNQSVYELGDTKAIALCIGAMVIWILIINILIWRPLYQFSLERYQLID